MRDVAETLGFALPDVTSPFMSRPSQQFVGPATMDRLKQQAQAMNGSDNASAMQAIAAQRLREQNMQQNSAAGAQLGSTAGMLLGGYVGGPAGAAAGSALGNVFGSYVGRKV